MTVEEVDPSNERARQVRRILGAALKQAFEFFGDDLAGFALVTWDMRGGAHSGYLTEYGMVGESLMPAYVHDSLNRHLSVVLVERTESVIVPDPIA